MPAPPPGTSEQLLQPAGKGDVTPQGWGKGWQAERRAFPFRLRLLYPGACSWVRRLPRPQGASVGNQESRGDPGRRSCAPTQRRSWRTWWFPSLADVCWSVEPALVVSQSHKDGQSSFTEGCCAGHSAKCVQ